MSLCYRRYGLWGNFIRNFPYFCTVLTDAVHLSFFIGGDFMQKKMITRFLCFLSAFCSVFWLTCSSFGSRPSDRVSADALSVTLTYEQTLAYYGTNISGTYYNDTNYTNTAITFSYVGTTEQLKPPDWSGSVHYYYTPQSPVYPYEFDSLTGGLVYICTDWGASNPNFVTSNTTDHANIFINPSVYIQCSEFRQQVLYTTPQFQSLVSFPNRSYITVNYGNLFQNFTAFRIGNNNYAYCITSLLENSPTVENVAEQYRWQFFGVPIQCQNIDSPISRFDFTLNYAGAVDVNGLSYGATSYFMSKAVFLVLGLPTLTGYEPPETTTTPRTTRDPSGVGVGTAASYVTPEPVNLSTLESGVQAIVGEQLDMNANLDWIGNNIYTLTNNSAYICDVLDRIYARMVADGEIAVNLVPASTMPQNTQINDYIQSQLGNFTTAQLPDSNLRSGVGFISSIIDVFTSGYSWFFILGGLCLTLTVLSFVIFRR